MKEVPAVRPISIVGGLAGVVSTFNKHVERIAEQYSIDAKDLFFELGKRKVVAGQEDIIIEVARTLAMDH
jgi:4-hydroxy 2-oxovalerate aldolase